MKPSKAQLAVLEDLKESGPVTIGIMGWPERNGEPAHFKFHRITSTTFDALVRKKLIAWRTIRDGDRIVREYRSLEPPTIEGLRREGVSGSQQ